MDGRNVAQDRIAHVERLAGARVERRRQQCRIIVDLRDQAQPAFEIKRAGLLRNIGGGIMQVEKGCEFRRAAFGDNPARTVSHKAVDHYPVILCDPPHTGGCHLTKRVERRGASETLNHELDGGKRIGDELIRWLSGFEFDYEVPVNTVRTGIEWTIGNDTQNRIEQVARFDEIDLLAKRVQTIDLVARKKAIDRSVE